MSVFGIFRKNKRTIGFRRSRIFGAIFLVMTVCLSLFSGLTQAVDAPVPSVKITSEHTSYENNVPGSWNITKSADWTDVGKARVTFEVDSVIKYDDSKDFDVLMVIDSSGSMDGDKITQVKIDATNLVSSLLSNRNNKVALVTFNTGAEILSGFTNNADTILNHINIIEASGNTNYYQGLVKAESVLDGYVYNENRKLILLFLTDGYPNNETPNEIAQYRKLKSLYPDMVVNGIQYEMGDTILQPIVNVSDHQYIATMTDLNNVLFDASISPYIYEDFVITDYVNTMYWKLIEDASNVVVKASIGTATIDVVNQTVTWDMSGIYHSGGNATLTIDIELNNATSSMVNNSLDDSLLLPTNSHETIKTALEDTPDEDIDSDLTPILKAVYNVIYDANAPSDCEVHGTVPEAEAHIVFDVVEISDNVLTCSEYNFKGWRPNLEQNRIINDDYFRMPARDVVFKAIWTKPSISKTMNGELHVKATATFDTGSNVNVKLKQLSGQSEANYNTDNAVVTAIEKADTLFALIDTNDSAHIISSSDSMTPIYAWYNEGIIYYYTDAEEIYLNTNASNMFYGFSAAVSIEGSDKWITKNTTNMSSMFYNMAQNATAFQLDLSNWNTSNVTNMSSMFRSSGYGATSWSVGDLSNWDTSKVTNMSSLFQAAGYSATSWTVGNLSNWNTSKVTNMSSMFYAPGYRATTWSVGDLSNWNTSRVYNMTHLFRVAGYSATDWSVGDLSNWNTSSATNMSYMFYGTGHNSRNWSVGNLSNWDTSKVTGAIFMFAAAGNNSSVFELNISGWNTSKMTDMSSMFSSAGRNSSTWLVTIPQTNGNGIVNAVDKLYGSTTSVYAEPSSGKSFTLAP